MRPGTPLQETLAAPSAKADTGSVVMPGMAMAIACPHPDDRGAHHRASFDRPRPNLTGLLGGSLVPSFGRADRWRPGIGKSTLLIQALALLAERLPALYQQRRVGENRSACARRPRPATERTAPAGRTCVERILALAARENQPGVRWCSIRSDLLHRCPAVGTRLSGAGARIGPRLVRFAKQTGSVAVPGRSRDQEGAGRSARARTWSTRCCTSRRAAAFRLVRAIRTVSGRSCGSGRVRDDGRGLREVANPSAIFLSRLNSRWRGVASWSPAKRGRCCRGARPGRPVPCQIAPGSLGLWNRTGCRFFLPCFFDTVAFFFFDQDVFLNVVGGVRSPTGSPISRCCCRCCRASVIDRSIWRLR